MKNTILIIFIVFFSCKGQNKAVNDESNIELTSQNIPISEVLGDSFKLETNYQEDIEDAKTRETRIRFENFTLIIHDFKGYDISLNEMTGRENEIGERKYWGQFGGSSELKEGILNDNEFENENYYETLIALQDTLHLSESLVMGGSDNKINKTLFHIIPKNENENYKISFCYLNSLYEMFDDRNLSETEVERLYKNSFFKKEHTDFVSIKDSSKYYFPLTLVLDHQEQACYTNGTMTKSFYEKELNRIKKKYTFADTLIMFSGEGGSSYSTLTKDNKIFGYDTYGYLFKIERLKDKKITETKYLVIYIASGC